MCNSRILIISIFVAICSILCSCQKEDFPRGARTSSAIEVSLLNVNGTKSLTETGEGELFGRMSLAPFENGDSLIVEAYVAENTLWGMCAASSTKGAVTSTSSLATNGNLFGMTAYLGSENRPADLDNYRYIDWADVCYGEADSWHLAETVMWRNDIPTTFWSVYPKNLASGTRNITWPQQTASDDEQSVISFSYEMPYGSVERQDAQMQEDLLFACTCQRWTEQNSDAKVNVDFQHALSAIRFDISGALASECTIKEISIDGVAYSGNCIVTNESGNLSFDWTNDSATAMCSQVYDAADFAAASTTGTAAALQSLDNSKIFFFIPQAVKGKNIKMGLRYTRADGNETVSECVLSHELPWEAGKIYTYKIGVASDKVDVQLMETLSGNVKSDVFFRNNGNTKIWVRAALVGNWFNESGKIVAPWSVDDTESGSFEGFPGSDWVRKSDGFYYYTKALEPKFLQESGSSTSKLFTKYTRKAGSDGRHLELMVLVQGVRYDNSKTYETAWQ